MREKLLAMVEAWVDAQGGKVEDVGDFRRIVQCWADLTRTDADAAQVVRVIMDPPADQYAN